MRSIADIKVWQRSEVTKMGGWLSRAWLSLNSKQAGEHFSNLKAQGFFNLKLAPTAEELCPDDDDGRSSLCFDDDDDDDDDRVDSLLQGQLLRSNVRNQSYKSTKSPLENRRPALYQSFFS